MTRNEVPATTSYKLSSSAIGEYNATIGSALRRLVPVDPQAQLGLASFAEAEKLRGLSKSSTKAN